jgi:hypothetical protein
MLGQVMAEEIPEANPPVTSEEQSAVAKLSEADLRIIDDTLLANSADRWLKVARVVISTETALRIGYPALSYVFYTQRLADLVERSCLESQGDIAYIRFSEVRIPNPGTKE